MAFGTLHVVQEQPIDIGSDECGNQLSSNDRLSHTAASHIGHRSTCIMGWAPRNDVFTIHHSCANKVCWGMFIFTMLLRGHKEHVLSSSWILLTGDQSCRGQVQIFLWETLSTFHVSNTTFLQSNPEAMKWSVWFMDRFFLRQISYACFYDRFGPHYWDRIPRQTQGQVSSGTRSCGNSRAPLTVALAVVEKLKFQSPAALPPSLSLADPPVAVRNLAIPLMISRPISTSTVKSMLSGTGLRPWATNLSPSREGSSSITTRSTMRERGGKQHELDTSTWNCASVGVAERIVPTSEPLTISTVFPFLALPTHVAAGAIWLHCWSPKFKETCLACAGTTLLFPSNGLIVQLPTAWTPLKATVPACTTELVFLRENAEIFSTLASGLVISTKRISWGLLNGPTSTNN